METDQAQKLAPIYISKRTVRTDVLTRQALIPPIFRRKEQLKRDAKYLRVHAPNYGNGTTLSPSEDAHRNELFIKYRTEFNYISPELVLNKKSSGSDSPSIKKKREEPVLAAINSIDKRRKTRNLCKDTPYCIPQSPWMDRMLPALLRFFPQKDGMYDDPSKDNVKDKVLNLYKSGKQVDEATLKETASVLSNVVEYIDNWREQVKEATSTKITIEEARSFMEEFREICGGLIKVDLATEIDNDIKTCEAFGAKVRMTMTTLSSSAERMVSLEEVEVLLKEAQNCRFLVPEVVALQSIFRNLIALRSLMESSVIDLDLSECESLVATCGKGIVRLPRLDELRKHLQESVWLHTATKVSQRPVKYSLAKSLMDNIPATLKCSKLYELVQDKCMRVERWLARISQYSFFKALSNDHTFKGLFSKKESMKKQSYNFEKIEGEKCDVRTFEELCTTYHKLELTLPVFRSIEPLYQSLKRLQRRYIKIENMIKTNSRSPNIATDCIWLLQHSEPLSEFLDLTEYLQPVRSGVELWLEYEKKCRKVLDTIKSFTISRDFNRLKTEWNFLINFRRTTKLTDADLSVLIELMKEYDNEERVAFGDIQALESEFGSLRIKNLVLQREISEINEKGSNLRSKVETALENVIDDKSKSDSVLAHLVMVAVEVLKFGAKMDCMATLLASIQYLRWSRGFYSLLFATTAITDEEQELRVLAREGASEQFQKFTKQVVVHEDVINHISGLGCVYKDGSARFTEFELLQLLAV